MPMRMIHRLFLYVFLALPLLISATATPPETLSSAQVVVFADDQLHRFESTETSVNTLLANAGVDMFEGDLLFLNGIQIDLTMDVSGKNPIVLQVERNISVSLNNASLKASASTVAGALWKAGVRLRISDAVSPDAASSLSEGLDIVHTPATLVRVQVGPQTLSTYTASQTVGGALQDAGLGLQGLDYSIPGTQAPVPEDRVIQVVRVEEEILLEQVSIPFDTLTQPVEDLEIDSTQVVQVGQFGLQASRVRVRLEDGVEVSRVTEAEWTAVQPKARIIGYGTKIVVRTMSSPDGPIEYWRSAPVFATSYSPCRLGIDACGNTTASGLPLAKGMVGVIRSWYNAMVFSQIYVPGYGVGVIADIGGGVAGRNWIDLGYSDDDWVSWAANTTVYFLTPVPSPDQILWILP